MLQRARFSAAERCGNLKLFPPPSLTISGSASTRCFMSKRSLSFSSAPSQPGWWGSSWRRRTSCRALCALESRAASWAAAPCTPGGVQPARPWSGHRPAWLPASPPSLGSRGLPREVPLVPASASYAASRRREAERRRTSSFHFLFS